MLIYTNMTDVRATVRNSLVSTVFPEGPDKRRATIDRMPSPARRSVALLLHELTVRHPQLAAKFLGLDYDPDSSHSLEYVNSGSRSDVFKADSDTVMKVVRNSVGVSTSRQKAIVANHSEGFAKLQEHIGAFTIPQSVDIEPHPLFKGISAVVVRQKFLAISDPQLFRGEEDHSIQAQIERLRTEETLAASQLPEFLHGSRILYQKHGILPDTGGIGNLVLNTESHTLVLIDGEPITPEFPDAQASILDHLDQLEAAL